MNLWFYQSAYMGARVGAKTEKLYSKLRQFHARCVRTMSHITLAQSRMYQIPTREIETELGLVNGQILKYIARRQLRWLGHVSRMPFDRLPRRLLSSWLPYTRDQGVPRRWPSVRQWSKHWKPLISIRSTGLQWLPIVPIGAIGSTNDTFLLRRVNT